MTRFAYLLALSLFIAAGSGISYADNNHRGNGKDRHEQTNKRYDKDSKKGNKKNDKDWKPGKSDSRHWGNDKKKDDKRYHNSKKDKHYGHPGPSYNPRPAHYGYSHPRPPHNLGKMVKFASRGARDVQVWQVDYDTYVVRYRKGHKWYTRYVYPHRNVYGNPSLISVNWTPPTPWQLIPPIQLNINL